MQENIYLLHFEYGKLIFFFILHIRKGVRQLSETGILGGYCYGPADLVQVWTGPSVVLLQLSDSAGRKAEAIYSGYAYLPEGKGYAGMHLSLVQQVSADQLLSMEIKKRTLSEGCLRKWEKAGMKFYLHVGNQSEFLVVAKNLNYRMLD